MQNIRNPFIDRRTPRRKLVFSSSDDEIDETSDVHVLRQEHQQHVDEQFSIRTSPDLTFSTSSCTTTRITRSKLEHFGFNSLARPSILRASTGTLKRRSSKSNNNHNKKLRTLEPSIETNKLLPAASCHPMQTRSQSSSDSHSDHLVKLFDKTLSTVTPIRDSTNTNDCDTATTTTITTTQRRRGRPLRLCLSDSTNEMPILEENPQHHQKRSRDDDEEENSEQCRSLKRNKVIDENNKENVFFNKRTRRTNFVRSFTDSHPVNEEQIKASVELGCNRDLIGDRSRSYLLPRCKSRKHADLACINAETMVDLLRDVYASDIESVHVIDCRYPYEYEGGHIKSAKNFYTRSQIFQEYFRNRIPSKDPSKRTIFVFHCEFSSERAPSLLRYFRAEDRNFHQASYPALFYPEIYLLDGGYKTFYEYSKEFCLPDRYRTMVDVNYQEQCRLYRSLSKQSNKFNEQTMTGGGSRTRTSLTFRSYLSFPQQPPNHIN